MADADDADSWLQSAARCAELAAHQIARLRNPWWNPPWRDLVPAADAGDDDEPARAAFTARWGSRAKRSRLSSSSAAVCSAARFAVKREAAAGAGSPATPFDFGSGSGSGSGASTSGGEDGSSSPEAPAGGGGGGKRRRAGGGAPADASGAGGGCETKGLGIEQSPLVFRLGASRDIRRTGKKKTICELQEEEKSLLFEKNMLQKEMGLRRKAYEALIAENQRLKSQQEHIQSERLPTKSATARASSSTPTSSSHFVLPDLNEPVSENLD